MFMPSLMNVAWQVLGSTDLRTQPRPRIHAGSNTLPSLSGLKDISK